MKRLLLALSLLTFFYLTGVPQVPVPPPLLNHFEKVSTYLQIAAFVDSLSKVQGLVKGEVIGKSVKGRNLYALKFSASDFGRDTSKVRVLIFAQQHGNEQSGKEGALLLAAMLMKPENRYLFDRIDLALVPQVNADGSEVNRRNNANSADLNRSHVVMIEPETRALHGLFDRYLFEVTMDVHEYSPYGESWRKYGYRKNSDITIGATTNLNVPEAIRRLSFAGYLPFAMDQLRERGFSAFHYCPGGPPEADYIRFSTFDVNDGRQSLGIQGTFSFIQEGMNGRDDLVENLQRRTLGQMTGMMALLRYCYDNAQKIKRLVWSERHKLLSPSPGEIIAVQCAHVADGTLLDLPLLSYSTGRDTVVQVKDFRPVVKPLLEVAKPFGYLIPKECTTLADWVMRQNFRLERMPDLAGFRLEQYQIGRIDTIDFEGDPVINPECRITEAHIMPTGKGYLFIPTSQLKGNLLVLALEPMSMLGLSTYKKFSALLESGKTYPVLRVVRKY